MMTLYCCLFIKFLTSMDAYGGEKVFWFFLTLLFIFRNILTYIYDTFKKVKSFTLGINQYKKVRFYINLCPANFITIRCG